MSVMLVDCSNCHTPLELPPGAKSIRCALCQAVTPFADSSQPSPYSTGSPFPCNRDQSTCPMMLLLLHKAERKYEVGKVTDEEQAKQRRLRSILNKLTYRNFVKLFYQVNQVNIDNVYTLSGLVCQIFDRTIMEPTLVEVYAEFCSRLDWELPGFVNDNEKITFKRLLLNKCQQEFEREEEEETNRTEEEQEEARRRKLGNISLICELYKKGMLTERIMHECIKKLLGSYQNNVNPDEEDIEVLCKLMSTVGEMIDRRPKSKEYMDASFDKMFQLSNNMSLSSRLRFMLKDAIDIRGGGHKSVVGSRLDRRPSKFGLDDKWNKRSGGPMGQGWDQRREMGYPARGNHSVFRTPRDQYAGRILSGGMRSPGPQMQRNNSDSERWQRTSGYQKGLMPSTHTPMMLKPERKYEVGKVTDEEQAKQRRLKSILNKLTPQNFEKLFDQVKQVNIDKADTLSGVIGQIFGKALMEPTFVEMYANFCFHLALELPGFGKDNEQITFRRLLFNKCQEGFERGERGEEEANRTEEREEARRRKLGYFRLICELYKKKMLTRRIMLECIKKLLGFNQKNPNPDEEDIEALCKSISTFGKMIDHPYAKERMDAYFDMMFQLSNNMSLSSRVRFMLKDTIDLRKNKWQPRRKVEEVHQDAAQESQAQFNRAIDLGKNKWQPRWKVEEVHRDAAQESQAQSSRESDLRKNKWQPRWTVEEVHRAAAQESQAQSSHAIDLRKNKWQPRWKVEEVHRDAAQERQA